MLGIEVVAFDHVALATWDVTASVRLLRDVLGAAFLTGGDVHEAGYRWLQFTFPGGTVEVLEPIHRDGFLYRFLTQRGEGLHHITLKVRDLAGAIPTLTEAGYEPVDVDLSHEMWKEAFLHPRDTSGVLIQLAETPDLDVESRPPSSRGSRSLHASFPSAGSARVEDFRAPLAPPPGPPSLEDLLADRPGLRPPAAT